LRWFRDRNPSEALARDHGISRVTAYRYAGEFITVLADQACQLSRALERVRDEGFSHVILDGTVIPCDRCKEPAVSVKGEAIDLWYSGKAHTHGAGIGILIPVKQPRGGRELDVNTRTRNAIQHSLRCLGERGFALLTGRWRILQHITASPSKIGDIARAALVLTHFEYGYIT